MNNYLKTLAILGFALTICIIIILVLIPVMISDNSENSSSSETNVLNEKNRDNSALSSTIRASLAFNDTNPSLNDENKQASVLNVPLLTSTNPNKMIPPTNHNMPLPIPSNPNQIVVTEPSNARENQNKSDFFVNNKINPLFEPGNLNQTNSSLSFDRNQETEPRFNNNATEKSIISLNISK